MAPDNRPLGCLQQLVAPRLQEARYETYGGGCTRTASQGREPMPIILPESQHIPSSFTDQNPGPDSKLETFTRYTRWACLVLAATAQAYCVTKSCEWMPFSHGSLPYSVLLQPPPYSMVRTLSSCIPTTFIAKVPQNRAKKRRSS